MKAFWVPTVAVVMPSYLGEYKGAAKDREKKFHRAVKSFLSQNYPRKKLIIISDGCLLTKQIYQNDYSTRDEIDFIFIEKQPEFSGNVRNVGIEHARKRVKAEFITYLDTDDMLFNDHILRLVKNYDRSCQWCYSDDWLWKNKNQPVVLRNVYLAESHIGTSNIIHRSELPIKWPTGYGHDWKLIKFLKKYKHKKIGHSGYVVCHIPGVFDN